MAINAATAYQIRRGQRFAGVLTKEAFMAR
jgi:hypothetical protein